MVLHVAASNLYVTSVFSFEWQVFNVYDSLVRFCVPVLFMISGVFFLDPARDYTLKKLFRKNISRIIKAYLFWSACYSILTNLFTQKASHMQMIHDITRDFIFGHFHLWFLFTLVGLYLIVPFLRKICEEKYLMQYFLILSFVFCFIVNLLKPIPVLGDGLIHLLGKTNLYFVLGYSGCFILGYYLNHYELTKKGKRIVYLLGIVSVVATILVASFLSLSKGEPVDFLYEYLLPNTCFTSAALFLFFKEKISKIQVSANARKQIYFLSKLSFGMYLVHDFVNIIFEKILKFTTLMFQPILSVPVISILVFLISFFIIYGMDKVPFFSKHVL